MKVVFLDIDGVLNNTTFDATPAGWPADAMDPRSIGVLNTILERSGAKVVISSSWRKMCDTDEIRRVLYEAGFKGDVIGETPCLYGYKAEEVAPRRLVRGDEIQEWMDCQVEKPSHFVILDDDADMAHLLDHLVQTPTDRGLALEHIEPALKLLGAT